MLRNSENKQLPENNIYYLVWFISVLHPCSSIDVGMLHESNQNKIRQYAVSTKHVENKSKNSLISEMPFSLR